MEGGRKLTEEEKLSIINGGRGEGSADEGAGGDAGNNKDAPPEPKEEKKVDFDFSVFETEFGRKIEKKEDLLSLFEKADKNESLQSELSSLSEKLEDYKYIDSGINPLDGFLNEDEYMRQQLLIKKKDELSDDVVRELSVLTPSKVKEISDTEALTLQLMIDKGVSKDEAESYLTRKYDVLDFEDIEDNVKAAMKIDAVDARRDISKLYGDIKIPEKKNLEAVREQWNGVLPKIVEGITDIEPKEGFKFVVTDKMKEGISDAIMRQIIREQLPINEDSAGIIAARVRDRILLNNIETAFNSYASDLEEKFKAEYRDKNNNNRPLDSGGRRSEHSDESNDDKAKRMFLK